MNETPFITNRAWETIQGQGGLNRQKEPGVKGGNGKGIKAQ